MQLQEIFKVGLSAEAFTDPKNMRGHALRIQLHEISWTVPDIARSCKLIVHLEGMINLDLEEIEIEIDETGVGIVWIQIDDNENDIFAVTRLLAIAQQIVIIGVVELNTPIVLKCRIFAPSTIDESDNFAEIIG